MTLILIKRIGKIHLGKPLLKPMPNEQNFETEHALHELFYSWTIVDYYS